MRKEREAAEYEKVLERRRKLEDSIDQEKKKPKPNYGEIEKQKQKFIDLED